MNHPGPGQEKLLGHAFELNAAIAYQDGTAETLKFAEITAKGWSLATVDSGAAVGEWCDVAICDDGAVYISYHDADNGDLKVAYRATDTWSIEVVEDGEDTGLYTSLAVDATCGVSLSYYDAVAASLKVASGGFGDWNIETVDEPLVVGDDRGRWTSLALDGSGGQHVAYQDAALLDLKYAANTGSGWTLTTVDGVGNKGADACLVLDGSGYPQIVYQDGSNLSLLLAAWDGSAWNKETLLDGNDYAGSFGFYLGCGWRPSGVVVSHYYPLESELLIYPEFE